MASPLRVGLACARSGRLPRLYLGERKNSVGLPTRHQATRREAGVRGPLEGERAGASRDGGAPEVASQPTTEGLGLRRVLLVERRSGLRYERENGTRRTSLNGIDEADGQHWCFSSQHWSYGRYGDSESCSQATLSPLFATCCQGTLRVARSRRYKRSSSVGSLQSTHVSKER